MPDSRRFLHPEAIQRIAPLELRARLIVEGFLSGLHRSPYFGQSIEFRQHREYTMGDDLRHVDWKVWARQDRLYVKQYEEDTNLGCQLVVDVSNSMRYGTGPLNKYEYACTIAACFAHLLLKQQDSVGLTTFDQSIRTAVPMRTKRTHLQSVVEALNVAEPKDKTELATVFRRIAESLPRRGMVVIVSDLLSDTAAMVKGLRHIRQRGHDAVIFHIMDDDELDFPFSGPTRFDGLESVDFVHCNPRALREAYLVELQKFLDEVRHQCAKNQIDYSLVRTRDPLGAVLAKFLNRRLGHARKV